MHYWEAFAQYTLWLKKGAPTSVAITLSNPNRFSKFFHWRIPQEICSKVIITDPIVPWMCRYTTLWKRSKLLLSVCCAHERRLASLHGFGRRVEAGRYRPDIRWSRSKGERHLLPWRVPVTGSQQLLPMMLTCQPSSLSFNRTALLHIRHVTLCDFSSLQHLLYSTGSVGAKQSRHQSCRLQDMECRPAASVSVMGVQRWRTQAAFGALLAWHRPDHRRQCN